MMHMTFYWGKTVTILFDFWKTNSWLDYSVSLLACFIISVFYQYMEDRRLRFKLLSVSKPGNNIPMETPLLSSAKFTRGGRFSVARIVTAFLFGVNSAIGYMLMLAVMSFNAGVFVAVVVGLSVGYLVFRGGDESEVTVVDNPCACA